MALGVRRQNGSRPESYIELWETRSWTHLATVALDGSDLLALAFSNDGRELAAGDAAGRLHLLQVNQEPVELSFVLTRPAHGGQIRGLSFSRDADRLATCGTDGEVRIWSTKDLAEPKMGVRDLSAVSDGGNRFGSGACFVDAETAVTSDYSGVCHVWDRRTGQLKGKFGLDRENDNWFQLAAAYGHGLVAVTAGHWPPIEDASGRVLIQDVRRDRKHGSLEVGSICYSVSGFSPSARYLAVCCQGKVAVIDVQRTAIARSLTFSDFDGLVKSVRFSPDERWLVCGRNDGLVSVVSVPDFQVHHEFRADSRLADCVDISPDSKRVATVGFDHRINIHDLLSGDLILQCGESSGFICFVRYSPNGERLFTAGLGGKVRIWMSETGEELLNFAIPFAAWPSGEFSPDGSALIVTAAWQRTIFDTAPRHSLQLLSLRRLAAESCGSIISSPIVDGRAR